MALRRVRGLLRVAWSESSKAKFPTSPKRERGGTSGWPDLLVKSGSLSAIRSGMLRKLRWPFWMSTAIGALTIVLIAAVQLRTAWQFRILIVPLYLLALPFVLFSLGSLLWVLLGPRKMSPNCCRYCNYDLTGLASPTICPECGEALI